MSVEPTIRGGVLSGRSDRRLPEGISEWEHSLRIDDFWRIPGGDSFRPSRDIVHALIERAVTTGYLPADFPPTGGQLLLPDEALRRRREVAEWMDVNGKAVVGPVRDAGCVGRLRYAKKEDRLYVFIVPRTGEGRPPERVRLTLWRPAEGSRVMLLGSAAPLEWTSVPEGVEVSVPTAGLPCDFAWCLEITKPICDRQGGNR